MFEIKIIPTGKYSAAHRFYREDSELCGIMFSRWSVSVDAPLGSNYNRKQWRRAIRKAYGKSVKFYS